MTKLPQKYFLREQSKKQKVRFLKSRAGSFKDIYQKSTNNFNWQIPAIQKSWVCRLEPNFQGENFTATISIVCWGRNQSDTSGSFRLRGSQLGFAAFGHWMGGLVAQQRVLKVYAIKLLGCQLGWGQKLVSWARDVGRSPAWAWKQLLSSPWELLFSPWDLLSCPWELPSSPVPPVSLTPRPCPLPGQVGGGGEETTAATSKVGIARERSSPHLVQDDHQCNHCCSKWPESIWGILVPPPNCQSQIHRIL